MESQGTEHAQRNQYHCFLALFCLLYSSLSAIEPLYSGPNRKCCLHGTGGPSEKKADRDGTLTRVGYLIGSRSTDRQKKDDLKDLQVRLVDVHYSGLCIIMQSPVSSLLCTLHLFSIPSYALLLYGVVYSSIVVYYTDRYRTSCRLPDLTRRGWRPGVRIITGTVM